MRSVPAGAQVFVCALLSLCLVAPVAARDDVPRGRWRVTAPSADGPLDLELEPASLLAPDYRAERTTAAGTEPIGGPRPTAYRGRIAGEPRSWVRASETSRGLEGLGGRPGGGVVIGTLPATIDAAGSCGVTHVTDDTAKATASRNATDTHYTLRVAVDVDWEFVRAAGGAKAAEREVVALLNAVDGVYSTEIGLSLRLVYFHAWETEEDPYTATDAASRLSELTDHWNSAFIGVERDVTQMFTGASLDAPYVGMSWMSSVVLSPSRAYALVSRLGGPGGAVLAAHELGHTLGAYHDVSSPPTIMFPSVTINLTFSEDSRRWIHGYLELRCPTLASPACSTIPAPDHWRVDLHDAGNTGTDPDAVIDGGAGALAISSDELPPCVSRLARAGAERFFDLPPARYAFRCSSPSPVALFVDGDPVASGPAEIELAGLCEVRIEWEVGTGGRLEAELVSLAPMAPAALVVDARARAARLAWQDRSDDEDAFVVEIWDSASGWVEVARTRAGETTARVRGLTRARSLAYAVRAVNENGSSERVVAYTSR